jgi:hypothetical protein
MTCPHDNRPCGAPRCAVCPLTELSEDEALAALFVVAALDRSYVATLYDWRTVKTAPTDFGFAVVGRRIRLVGEFLDDPGWSWFRATRLYGVQQTPRGVYPGGRIDRGLGARRPGMKTAPDANQPVAANRGDQAPTD